MTRTLGRMPMVAETQGTRFQFARNVAFAWMAFAMQSVAGFVMPRLISDTLGQANLGIWDFAWSLVSYLALIQLGLSASVNRYVAGYRAQNDILSLTRSVSTIALFLAFAGSIAVLGAGLIAAFVVPMFAELGSHVEIARWVVFLLGLDVAVSFMFAVNTGIVVGCLRSDLHYAVSAFTYTVSAILMAGVVLSGGGLAGLAWVQVLSTIAGEIIRWRLARRVFPELSIVYRTASWAVLREQARFTAKATLPAISEGLVNQTLSVLLTLYLGPATLAIFSRPRNLIRQVRTLTARFGYVLVPAASALHARAANVELVETFLEKSVQISILMMPVAVSLLVLGDDLIRFWMGDGYANRALLTALVLGSVPSWVQEPAWSVLTGVNRHGRLAAFKTAASAFTALLIWVGLAFLDWRLSWVATALVIPGAIVDGLVVPWVACRAFGVELSAYYRSVWVKPVLYVCPFCVCLVLMRATIGGQPAALAGEMAISLTVLWVTYRQRVLPTGWAFSRG